MDRRSLSLAGMATLIIFGAGPMDVGTGSFPIMGMDMFHLETLAAFATGL
jgi:hypothetical protein